MKITGGATLHAPVGTVWTALNDPAVLVRTIPGCERLTATAPDTYQLTVTAGVGTDHRHLHRRSRADPAAAAQRLPADRHRLRRPRHRQHRASRSG